MFSIEGFQTALGEAAAQGDSTYESDREKKKERSILAADSVWKNWHERVVLESRGRWWKP